MPASDSTRLNHVYWIGGSPCSGKSTIAGRIAADYDMLVYRCDDAYHEHITRLDSIRQPVLHRLAHATADEIWLRPVQQQVTDELEIYREEFPMILDDLRALPANRPIIAEGAALLPELLASRALNPRRTIWMIPEESFQRIHYAKREWRHEILRDCSNPDLGWDNWMNRDAGFARDVALQAEKLGFRLITVDGGRSIDDVAAEVQRWLELPMSHSHFTD